MLILQGLNMEEAQEMAIKWKRKTPDGSQRQDEHDHLLLGTRVEEDVGILEQGMPAKRQLSLAET